MARIEKRNGRWRARVWGPDGRERSRTLDRKTDAERWAATQQADVARGQWVDPALGRLRFADWVSEWEAGLYGLRDGTLELNLSVVRNHLLPRFGGMQLSRITPALVRTMVADDTEAGYSPSAIRRHVFVLRSILSAAVSDGRLGRNVADDVKLPAERTRPMRFLTPAQVARIANAIRDHYRPLVLTAAWVGLRQGELFGLHMDRVDLLRRAVRIDQQLVDVNGRQSFGPPKTGAGVRTVTIPATLVDVLGEHFASHPCQSSGLAFPTVTGRPMRRNNFRKLWVRAVEECFGGTPPLGTRVP